MADSERADLERLQRINRTIEMIPGDVLESSRYPLHKVDFRVISPSEEPERIAMAHADELPTTIRALFYLVGALRRGGGNLLSYLLFERSYCRAMIRLGYQDTIERKDDLTAFLGY